MCRHPGFYPSRVVPLAHTIPWGGSSSLKKTTIWLHWTQSLINETSLRRKRHMLFLNPFVSQIGLRKYTNLNLHLGLASGGDASWARAHWLGYKLETSLNIIQKGLNFTLTWEQIFVWKSIYQISAIWNGTSGTLLPKSKTSLIQWGSLPVQVSITGINKKSMKKKNPN